MKLLHITEVKILSDWFGPGLTGPTPPKSTVCPSYDLGGGGEGHRVIVFFECKTHLTRAINLPCSHSLHRGRPEGADGGEKRTGTQRPAQNPWITDKLFMIQIRAHLFGVCSLNQTLCFTICFHKRLEVMHLSEAIFYWPFHIWLITYLLPVHITTVFSPFRKTKGGKNNCHIIYSLPI